MDPAVTTTFTKLAELRRKKNELIAGLHSNYPGLQERILGAEIILDKIFEELSHEFVTVTAFGLPAPTNHLALPVVPLELDLPTGVTKEAVDALILQELGPNAVGIPCTAAEKKAFDDRLAETRRQVRALPEKHLAEAAQGVENQEPQDLPLNAMGLQVSADQKRALDELLIGNSRLSKRAFPAEKQQEHTKRPKLDGSPADVPNVARTTQAKPARITIAPLRRPTKVEAWYSYMTSTEAAWAQVNPARKRQLSHIGYIDETDAGMPASRPCYHCSTMSRPNRITGKNESMCCMVYKPETVKNYTQVQGYNTRSCSNCWASSLECEFVRDEKLKNYMSEDQMERYAKYSGKRLEKQADGSMEWVKIPRVVPSAQNSGIASEQSTSV